MAGRESWILAANLCLACADAQPGADPAGDGTDAGEWSTEDTTGGAVDPGEDALPDADALGPQDVRRLSRSEVRWVVLDLLGHDPGADLDLLPDDERTPFDNDSTTQFPSEALIVALDAFAQRQADRVLAEPVAAAALVGCTPQGPDDAACLREFIERFGRRALRRPLADSEVVELLALQGHADDADDFYVAVGMVIHALLLDVEFIYRLEVGKPVPGDPRLRALSAFELASRLSFFLWGSAPDDALLDEAAAGDLDTRDGIAQAADRMLDDPRASQQVERLHAQWLGYDVIPAGEVSDNMARESGALLRHITIEQRRPWLEVFTEPRTFIDAELAQHYGLPDPGAGTAWVDYPANSGRAGLLSHGSFLSGLTNFGDTSPVLRGRDVLERLLCRELPPPPDNVDAAEPPEFGGPDACKAEIFSMREQAACSGCHASIDNIGYGLERFGPAGRWRDHEPDRPDCPIDGKGDVAGLGSFSGPGELGALLVDSGELEACFVEHFLAFANGRPTQPEDAPTIDALTQSFQDSETDFASLLLTVASSEAFRFRVVEE